MAIIRRPVASAILFLVEFTALTQRRRERGEPQSWFNRNHAVGFLTQRRKDAKAQRLKRKMSLENQGTIQLAVWSQTDPIILRVFALISYPPAEYFRLKCQSLVTSAPTGFNGFVSAALCVLCASALRLFFALNPLHRPAGVFGNQWLGIFGGLLQSRQGGDVAGIA